MYCRTSFNCECPIIANDEAFFRTQLLNRRCKNAMHDKILEHNFFLATHLKPGPMALCFAVIGSKLRGASLYHSQAVSCVLCFMWSACEWGYLHTSCSQDFSHCRKAGQMPSFPDQNFLWCGQEFANIVWLWLKPWQLLVCYMFQHFHGVWSPRLASFPGLPVLWFAWERGYT